MTGLFLRPFRGLFAVLVVLALGLAACSSGGATTAPTTAPTTKATQTANPTDASKESQAPDKTQAPESQAPDNGESGLASSVSKLSDIKSYKFKIVMKGGSYGDLLGGLPITGTVISSPEKAAEMSFMGMNVREVGGKSYVDLGSGSWIESTDSSTTSMADGFAPEKMFGSYISGSTQGWYKPAGDEQKNGVATTHYTADASAIGSYGSMLGVKGNAKWSADVWIAKDGGYAVSYVMKGTGDAGATMAITMDLTDVNSSANTVTTP